MAANGSQRPSRGQPVFSRFCASVMLSHPVSSHLRVLASALTVAWFVAAPVGNDTDANAAERAPVTVEQTFVPAGKPNLWPGGRDANWVLIPRDRLDRLLQIVNQNSAEARTVPFDRAEYSARFDPRTVRLIAGTARLTGSDLPHGPQGGLVGMDPLNLAVSKIRWTGPEEQPALLGTDRQGRQRLYVPDGASTLEFDWSLMGRQRLNGMEFRVSLPAAVVSTITLNLPLGWTVTSDTGLVSGQASADGSRFTVELGIRNHCRLRLLESGHKSSQSSAGHLACRLSSRYSIRTGQLRGVCEAGFSAIAPGTTELALVLPSDLHVDSAEQSSGATVAWSVSESAPDRLQRVLFQLVDGAGSERDFVVHFTADLPPVGATTLAMPRVDDAVLLDGRLTVAVEAPDRIQSYTPLGLRQTSVSSDDDGHQISFQQFQSPAHLRLRVSPRGRRRTQNLNAREFALLDLRAVPPTLTADLEVTPQHQGVFTVESDVPRGCEITTVEISGSADKELLNWAVLPASASHERLVIDLPDGIPEDGMRFRITGQYPDIGLSNLVIPAILPVAVRSADLVLAVATDSGRRLDVSDQSLLSALTTSASADRAAWSNLYQPADAAGWAMWQSSYRGQPGSLLRARFSADNTEAVNAADGEGLAGDPTAPGQPVAKILASDVAGVPVVTTTMQTRTNPGSTGREHHLVAWRFLYASARRTFNFELPSGSHILSMHWNDTPLEVTSDVARLVAIPTALPGDVLSLEYTLPSPRVSIVGPLRVAMPRADAVSVGFKLSLSTPREFEVLSLDGDLQQLESANGLQWLFGPLARRSLDWPFDPFQLDDWRSLFGMSFDRSQVPNQTMSESSDWRTIHTSASTVPVEYRIRVGHVVRLRGLAWFTLAACLLTGVLLRAIELPQRNRIGLFLVICGGASGALLPLPVAEIAGASVLGICVASLIPRRLIRQERFANRPMASTITLQRVLTSLLLCLLVTGHAADAQVSNDVDVPETISILVPYTGDGFRPENASDIVFIRDEVLRSLVAAANVDDEQNAGPLISEAHWTGTLENTGRVNLTLALTVDVSSPGATSLELPIAASLLPPREEVRIDGQPATVQLTPDGKNVRVSLPPPEVTESATTETGVQWRRHIVELDLRARANADVDGSQLVLPAIRVAQNQLSLQFPTQPATVTSLGRSLAWALTPTQLLTVRTGLESQLTLNWAEQFIDESERPQPSIEIRSAVELHPNWLQRRTLVSYEDVDSPIRSIAWRLPPGARISRQQIRTPQLAEVDIRESATGVIVTAELDPPATGDFTVLLDWQQMLKSPAQKRGLKWPVAIVPGQPEMELFVSRHLAGLTTETGLEPGAQLEAAAESARVKVEDFLDSWPVSDLPRTPRLTVRVADDLTLPPIAVPIEARRQVRQRQTARVSQKTIDWTVSTEIDTTLGRAFQHQFHVPPELEVEFVSVQEEGVERLSHWDQQGDTLFLHLRDQTTGIQNVVIQGRQEVPPAQSFAVPNVRIVDADLVESTLLVYRSPDVIPSVKGAEIIESATGDERPSSGRFFFRRFQLSDDPNAVVTMTVEPLDTPPSLWAIATLQQMEGRLRVKATLRLEAMQLRQAVIELTDWPFDGLPVVAVTGAESDATAEFDPETSSLRVGLSGALPADVELTLSAWLVSPAEDGPLVIAPPVIEGFQRNAALLSTGECRFRLDSSETPDAGTLIIAQSRGLLDPETSDAYHLWKSGDRLMSTLELIPLDPPQPLVMHLLRPGLPGSGISATQILLQSTEASHVTIRWPAQARPLAVFRNGQRVESKAGLPAAAGAANAAAGRSSQQPAALTTRIAVPADGSPSLIEVLWESVSTGPALRVQRHTIRLPRVTPSSEERTFVLAAPRPGVNASGAGQTQDAAVSAQYTHSVLDWLEFLGESSQRNARTSTRATLALWNAGQLLPLSSDNELSSFLSGMPVAAQSSGMTDLTAEVLAYESPRMLLSPQASENVSLWLVDDWTNRLLTCLALALAAVPVLMLVFRLKTFETLARRPEASWLLLGVVWWICLEGSAAGFMVAAGASVWMLIRWNQHRVTSAAGPGTGA